MEKVNELEEETSEAPEEVVVEAPDENRVYHWIMDEANFAKTCEKCGAVIRGAWAFREKFDYCPKCGAKTK